MPLRYEVKQGDCIESIAFEHGFFPDTIWNFAANADLKKRRKDPNALAPGDIVVVPDKRLKEVKRPLDAVHRFRRKGVPKSFRVQFLRFDQTPLANEPVTVDIDGQVTKMTTDGDGWIQRMISPAARKATIEFKDGKVYTLQLGHLNPIDTPEGIQQRLSNLGMYRGRITAEMTDEATEALRMFQYANDLPATGSIDEATKQALLGVSND